MATTQLQTVDELERTPPDVERWELIDGELIEMSPAGGEHGEVGIETATRLWNHVKPRRHGRVYGEGTGFVLGPRLIIAPDAAFVRADRLPSREIRRKWLRLAPDLVVEVESPSDRMAAVRKKVRRYLEAGVRLVWLIDPRRRLVTVYAADGSTRILHEGDELDGGEVLPDFRVAVADLFA